MKKELALSFLAICLGFSLMATKNDRITGARSGAMGNASVTFSSVYSAFNNQAGLGGLEYAEAGIAYRNHFMLSETGYKAAAVAVPFKSFGVIGVSFSSFGYSAYGEHQIGLAYAKQFGKKLSMALQLDYLQLQFNEPYGSTGVLLGEFGVQAQLTQDLRFGFHVYNPTRAYLNKDVDERVPTYIKAGLAYEFSEKLLTTFEINKDLDHNPDFRVGVEYKPVQKLAIRAGFNTSPASPSLGAGFLFGNWRIDLSSEYHYALGFTPQASIRYVFEKSASKKAQK
ncbi:hypothetical protein KFE98_01790 [bacterium SCSIO 12741]|nr:hypothetical protein KFE98_01790 [bacterium SCSIO 12741]